jgi:hypothetical protein
MRRPVGGKFAQVLTENNVIYLVWLTKFRELHILVAIIRLGGRLIE